MCKYLFSNLMFNLSVYYTFVFSFQRVEQKIDSLHEKFKDIAREEIEWTFYASTMMFMCKKKYTRRVLGCSITALSNSIQYRCVCLN